MKIFSATAPVFLRHRRSLLVIAVLCLLLIPPEPGASSSGAVRSGSVHQIRRGTLQRLTGNQWVFLRAGESVKYGERVRSSHDGVAVIAMPDQGEIVIGPGSDMTLARDEAGGEMKLERGAVWMQAKLPAGRTMTVRSPVLVAGIRGTKFSVLSDSDGAAVCTCEGLVDVVLPDSRVLASKTAQFVPVESDGRAPRGAMSDRKLLRRVTGGRYDWCFTCHEVGGRGRLKRDWMED